MTEDKLTPYEQYRHDSKWLWLHLRLIEEYRTEPIRRALRAAKALSELRKLSRK